MLAEVCYIVFGVQIAERYYIEADCTREAIDMYNNAGQWEEAHRVSTQALFGAELKCRFISLVGGKSFMKRKV